MINDDELAERLEVFVGQASPAACQIHARLPGVTSDGSSSLRGVVRGPICRYARTLPAQTALVDRGPGPSLLASLTLPEPCFWTAAMPQLYECQLELVRGGEVIARCTRSFGIRSLVVRGQHLFRDAQRWVLRGAWRASVDVRELPAWHDAEAALMIESPSEELCREASQVGVDILAVVQNPADRELDRLAQHPAVGIVALPQGAFPPEKPIPGIVLAEWFPLLQATAPAGWAQLLVTGAQSEHALSKQSIPMIALRRADGSLTPGEARRACDQLQQDLASRGVYSGYVV